MVDMTMKTVRLGDVVNIYNGSTPSTSDSENFNGNIQWITPKDLSSLKGIFVFNGERTISEKGFKCIGSKLLPKGTILLSSRAPIGLIAIAGTDLTTNQGFKNLVCDAKKIDNIYLYYLLKLKINEIQNLGSGTTFKEVSKSVLEDFNIQTHKNLKTQQSIAKILSQLDQKIALNNQINAQLEQMAKTLYEYWFVQFDFPDENGKPYKSSGGAMIYNEQLKREIPKGWGVGVLSEWIKNDKNGDWGKENNQGNYQLKVICIRGADINTIKNSGKIDAPNRFILNKNSDKIIDNYEFVIEISGGSPTQSTGRIAPISPYVIDRFKEPLICSNFCKIISLTNKYYFYNFYFLWKSIYDNDVLFGWEGKTSGIKNLLFDNFINNHIDIMPNADIVKNFFERIDIINQKQNVLLKQNQQLTQLRDFLLPMLMNGQVGVRDE